MNLFIYRKNTNEIVGSFTGVTNVSIVDNFLTAENEDTGHFGSYSLEDFTFKVDNDDI